MFTWQLGRIPSERVKVTKNLNGGISTASCWPKKVTKPAQIQDGEIEYIS